jgi:uncharacterized protein (DUF2336 family)
MSSQPLLGELDAALERGVSALLILNKLTDLFLENAATYSADHVEVFNDLMTHLLKQEMDRNVLVDLSRKLAPVRNAPNGVVARLSLQDDILVAGPFLERSDVLTDTELAAVARTKGAAHLSMIAGRPHLGEAVTDVLIDRGIAKVTMIALVNEGARFSEAGFAKLVYTAAGNNTLAAALASRTDLPAELRPFLVAQLNPPNARMKSPPAA